MQNRNIGEMGENNFATLCSEIGVTANKSIIDRYGWDYLLEFPDESQNNLPMDMQDIPIECKIQVKASSKNTGQCQIKLSAMDRLVKSSNPSFIYFVIYNQINQPKEAYLVHINEEIIGLVLKRIRKNEASKDKKQLNKIKITIKYQEEHKLSDVTGVVLKKKLKDYVPYGMKSYIQYKTNILQTIGYDEHTMSMKMTFYESDMMDIIDNSLGLKEKNVPVKLGKMMLRRFSIDMHFKTELDNIGNLSMNLKVQNIQRGYLLLKEHEYSTLLKYEVDVQFTPFDINGKSKFIFFNKYFKYIVDTINNKVDFKTTISYESKYHLFELLNYSKFAYIFEEQKGNDLYLELEVSNQNILTLDLNKFSGYSQMLMHYKVLKKLSDIFVELKIDTDYQISLKDLENNIQYIDVLYELIFGDLTQVTLEVAFNDNMTDKFSEAALLIPFFLNFNNKMIGTYIIFYADAKHLKEQEYKLISKKRVTYDYFIIDKSKFSEESILKLQTRISDNINKEGISLAVPINQYILKQGLLL